jgi:hypothetical protein
MFSTQVRVVLTLGVRTNEDDCEVPFLHMYSITLLEPPSLVFKLSSIGYFDLLKVCSANLVRCEAEEKKPGKLKIEKRKESRRKKNT